jgi:hypothetical protein
MRLLLDRRVVFPLRSLFAGILVALAAFLSWGAAASAATLSVVGTIFPGINTYSIVLEFTTAELVASYSISVATDVPNGYTGILTNTRPAAFVVPLPMNNPPTDMGTGVVGSWAGQAFGPVTGGTYTIGTVQLDMTRDPYYPGPGCQGPESATPGCFLYTINPFFTLGDYVRRADGSDVPTSLIGVVFLGTVPEPDTAALLGLGLLGLGYSRRRS